jgi:hypothetical protein
MWQNYIIYAATGFFGSVQLVALNAALRQYEALFVTPVYLSMHIIIQALAGIFCFNAADGFTVAQSIMFPVGILFTLAGVVILSVKQSAQGGEMEDIQVDSTASHAQHHMHSII